MSRIASNLKDEYFERRVFGLNRAILNMGSELLSFVERYFPRDADKITYFLLLNFPMSELENALISNTVLDLLTDSLGYDISDSVMTYSEPLQSTYIGRRILTFLDAPNLSQCSRVCKKWHSWIYGSKKNKKEQSINLPNNQFFFTKENTYTRQLSSYDFDDNNIGIDEDPYKSVLLKPHKSLLKWRIRLSGIPPKYRYNFWRYQTELDMKRESHNIMHRQPGVFELFVDQPPSPTIQKVIMDDISFLFYLMCFSLIFVTFVNDNRYDRSCEAMDIDESGEPLSEAQKQSILSELLHASSFLRDSVEYCQGMNHVAVELLRISNWNKINAFWLMNSFTLCERMKIYELYMSGLPRLHLCQYVFKHLIDQFLPKLAFHFDCVGVIIDMFSTEWLMTLYTSHCLLPPVTVSKVLDSFLIEGWKVIYRVGLSVLAFFEEKLKCFDMEQILIYLQRLQKSNVQDLTEEDDQLEEQYKKENEICNDTTSGGDSDNTTPRDRKMSFDINLKKIGSMFKKK